MAISTGAALIGGGLLGAAGSIMGGKSAASGAKDAANTQAAASDRAAQMQREMFDVQRQDYSPYAQMGSLASPLLTYYATGIRPTMSQADLDELKRLQGGGDDVDSYRLNQLLAQQQGINALSQGIPTSPMYTWQQEQGERAINRALAARGLYNSSAALNQLSDFNRALGAEESERQYGRLMDLTNIGRGAATQSGAAAANTGNALAGLYQAQGNALAQGQLAAGQARGSMYANLGAMPMNLYNTYTMTNALNRLGG